MNVKQEHFGPYEVVIKSEPNISGQIEGNYCPFTKQQIMFNINKDHDYSLVVNDSDDSDDIFSEIETEQSQTRKSLNVGEVKQEIFECEGSKIEYNNVIIFSENNQHFSTIIKEEPPDIPDTIDVSEFIDEKQKVSENIPVKTESEFLTSCCDLPTLKSESVEYSEDLVQPCSTKHSKRTLKILKTKANVSKTRRRYPCAVCHKDSSSSKSRSNHIDRHFRKIFVVCEFCGKLVTKTDFFRHHFIHSVQNRRRKISLKINDVSNEQQYEIMRACEKPLCSNEFNYESSLKHLIIHFDKKQTFQPFHLWEYLKETHSDGRSFKCEICLKKFKHKAGIEQHLISHIGDKPFQCDICIKQFKYKHHFQSHLKTIHSDNRPFKCDICSKQFKHKHHVKEHFRNIHSENRPFNCDICYKTFKQKTGLTVHLQIHSGDRPFIYDRPFKCDVCFKQFTGKYGLEKHSREAHSNDRPFKCDFCAKKFKRKKYIKRHLLIHTGEKPFKCNICSKKFTRKYLLRDHVETIHSNIRSFECDICSKNFNRKHNLSIHLKIVHSDNRPYKCDICSKQFKHKRHLQDHLQKHSL